MVKPKLLDQVRDAIRVRHPQLQDRTGLCGLDKKIHPVWDGA